MIAGLLRAGEEAAAVAAHLLRLVMGAGGEMLMALARRPRSFSDQRTSWSKATDGSAEGGGLLERPGNDDGGGGA